MELRFWSLPRTPVPGLGTSHTACHTAFVGPGPRTPYPTHSLCFSYAKPSFAKPSQRRPSSTWGLSRVPTFHILSFCETGLSVFAQICRTAGSGGNSLSPRRTRIYCLNGAPEPSTFTFPGSAHFPLSPPEWLLLARFTHRTQSTIPLSPA